MCSSQFLIESLNLFKLKSGAEFLGAVTDTIKKKDSLLLLKFYNLVLRRQQIKENITCHFILNNIEYLSSV